MNIASLSLFGIAIIAMPITYATKTIFDLNLIWIDPTLLLTLGLFFVVRPQINSQDKIITLILFVSSLISACVGNFYLNPRGDIQSALYDIFREPIKLWLNLLFYLLSKHYLKNHRVFTLKVYSVSIILQFCIAIYFWLFNFGIVSIPGSLGDFCTEASLRQSVVVMGMVVPRAIGTFWESPPLGLFMLAGFLIMYSEIYCESNRTILNVTGCIISLLGVIVSLADQVLLGLVVFFLLGTVHYSLKYKKILLLGGIVLFGLFLMSFLINHVYMKMDYDFAQGSMGERLYHTSLALSLLIDKPFMALFGIGPGRYGEYAAVFGLFPPTVTIQVAPVEIFVEYGFLGVITFFVTGIYLLKTSMKLDGFLGNVSLVSLLLANAFQANWKWEAFFFSLAYFSVCKSISTIKNN